MILRTLFALLLIIAPLAASAQVSGHRPQQTKPKPAKPGAKPAVKPAPSYPTVHILGLRPGITYDSVERVIKTIDGKWREVQIDTLTRNFGDKAIKIMVLDSIYVRFAYMRMAFVFDVTSNRLRRISITPRMSSILGDRDDDLSEILLLYFGQTWGKPEIQLDLTPAHYRWSRGNTEVRGMIRRGYPLWIIEG
ncbi:MAG TPA: hypothetical protein VFH43_09080 [Candidatus Kapabacteria bacterium]|nr:hypothetical protein [Candidatus Kapabacteria bacterium]